MKTQIIYVSVTLMTLAFAAHVAFAGDSADVELISVQVNCTKLKAAFNDSGNAQDQVRYKIKKEYEVTLSSENTTRCRFNGSASALCDFTIPGEIQALLDQQFLPMDHEEVTIEEGSFHHSPRRGVQIVRDMSRVRLVSRAGIPSSREKSYWESLLASGKLKGKIQLVLSGDGCPKGVEQAR